MFLLYCLHFIFQGHFFTERTLYRFITVLLAWLETKSSLVVSCIEDRYFISSRSSGRSQYHSWSQVLIASPDYPFYHNIWLQPQCFRSGLFNINNLARRLNFLQRTEYISNLTSNRHSQLLTTTLALVASWFGRSYASIHLEK